MYLNIILIIIIFTSPVFSQKKDESLNFSRNKNIFGRSVKITMLNDVNPVLLQKSNDTGFTLGTIIYFRFLSAPKKMVYELSLNSELYTQYPDKSYIK